MTWRDTLEIGSKQNASYPKDNVPPGGVIGPELPQGPRSLRGDSASARDSDADADAMQLRLPLPGRP
jgi:hypothetical protein